jgi:hypothetical protein
VKGPHVRHTAPQGKHIECIPCFHPFLWLKSVSWWRSAKSVHIDIMEQCWIFPYDLNVSICIYWPMTFDKMLFNWLGIWELFSFLSIPLHMSNQIDLSIFYLFVNKYWVTAKGSTVQSAGEKSWNCWAPVLNKADIVPCPRGHFLVEKCQFNQVNLKSWRKF